MQDYNYFYKLTDSEFIIQNYHIINSVGGGPLLIYRLEDFFKFGDASSIRKQLVIQTTGNYQLILLNNIIIHFIVGNNGSTNNLRHTNGEPYQPYMGSYLKLNSDSEYYFYYMPSHSGTEY